MFRICSKYCTKACPTDPVDPPENAPPFPGASILLQQKISNSDSELADRTKAKT